MKLDAAKFDEDIKTIRDQNIYWGFCPKANLYINNTLPDFSIFQSYREKICVGTDSLASNNKLSLSFVYLVLLTNYASYAKVKPANFNNKIITNDVLSYPI